MADKKWLRLAVLGSFFAGLNFAVEHCAREEQDMDRIWTKVMATALAVAVFGAANLTLAEAAKDENPPHQAVKVVQTAGRDRLGDFAPDFARYNDDILFGEIWSKNDVLSLHDRSMITVSALIASGVTDNSLKSHIMRAKTNGVTQAEMAELITQVAFYGGWPKAWAAFNYARDIYAG